MEDGSKTGARCNPVEKSGEARGLDIFVATQTDKFVGMPRSLAPLATSLAVDLPSQPAYSLTL